MGSGCDATEETVDYLNKRGEKVGLVKVHLYRPFSMKHFLAAIPATCKKIAVLDRTKEVRLSGRASVSGRLLRAARGGHERHHRRRRPLRPGLQGVQPHHGQGRLRQPGQGRAQEPLHRRHRRRCDRHLPRAGRDARRQPRGHRVSCMFYGLGSDGTVGANKNSIKIIGDHTDMYAQAYFCLRLQEVRRHHRLPPALRQEPDPCPPT